jgi:hypothetical protein
MPGFCSYGAELYSFMKAGNLMASRKNASRSSVVHRQCSPTVFTDSVHRQYSPTDNRIKELQFTPPPVTWFCKRINDGVGSISTVIV